MAIVKDFRFAWRQLRKSPGFTLIVVATLALCIGANTAVYSVVDAVLLRATPYPEPDRLAMVGLAWKHHGQTGFQTRTTGTEFEAVRDGAADLDVAAFSGESGANFFAQGRAEFIRQQRVSAGFFHVLGIAPLIGREFDRQEDLAGGPAVAVLSYPFWRRAFHGDPGIVGRPITLRGEPFTVIGVMPAEFRTTVAVDLWTPLRPSRTGEGGGSNYGVIGRLRPGASWTAVNAQLDVLSGSMMRHQLAAGDSVRAQVIPYERGATYESRTELLLSWASVLIVLFIGCINVAGLLLARASGRRRELATRMALGGSRTAVIRQLLAESVLLAAAGGSAGLLLGQFALAELKRLGAQNLALWHPITIDFRVLAAMTGVALLSSIVFGLVPAIEASRLDIRSALVDGGRGISSRSRSLLRSGLVIGEVALSLVLLVSAGLFLRTLVFLGGLNPGFQASHVLTAQASLQDARYRSRDQVVRLYAQTLDRIRQIPSVESAGVALSLPFERPLNDGVKILDGPQRGEYIVEEVYVTPRYFDTLKIPILDGRSFLDSDRSDAGQVAIVSASFARRFFPGESAIGHHLGLAQNVQIVGVVGDVQQNSGAGNFGPLSIRPTLYVPVSQTSDRFLQLVHTWYSPQWVVRASADNPNLPHQIELAIASVDPQLPIAGFRTMNEVLEEGTSSQRYQAMLFTTIAGLAVLLAAVGLYGLISHAVNQRMRELGIHLALGATSWNLVSRAVAPGVQLAAVGVSIGLVLAFSTVGLLKHLLWGVRPADPATFIATALFLMLVAFAASLLPALRLLRLDPATVLHND